VHDYLESSAEKSGASFLILSGIKGGVAILEGSTIGGEAVVTTDIQVGDAVQPIYDFIDVAWRVTFASGVIVCALGIYFVLPLATGVARYLSETSSAPMIDEGMAELKQLEEDSSPSAMQERFFPEGEKTKKKLNIKQKAVEILAWCKETTSRVITRGIRLCAGFLFDCFVFPFAILLIVYMVVKRGLSVFGLSSQHSMREDFRWMGEKYFKKRDIPNNGRQRR
jgi:hypothetical protein